MNYIRKTIDFARLHNYDVGKAINQYSLYQSQILEGTDKFMPTDNMCKQAHEKVKEDIIKKYVKSSYNTQKS